MQYDVKVLPSSEIGRALAIDRAEQIDAEYVPALRGDGFTIRAELRRCEPPRTVSWDEESRGRIASWWRRELDQGGALLAVEDDGRVLGVAVRGPVRRDSAEIVGMFVDAGLRGRGMGTALLKALEQNAADNGALSVYGGVNPTAKTVQFYLRNGYRIVALVDRSLGNWPLAETEIVMARVLADPRG
jgi:GNAT superfamily N-acetyltransferase